LYALSDVYQGLALIGGYHSISMLRRKKEVPALDKDDLAKAISRAAEELLFDPEVGANTSANAALSSAASASTRRHGIIRCMPFKICSLFARVAGVELVHACIQISLLHHWWQSLTKRVAL
jgi:uncharacterized membrane protein YgcG